MKFKLFFSLIILILLAACTQVSNELNNQEDNTIILGIFGGMGPEATADLYRQIVELTPASTDQEHIPTIIYSLPQVPDRMASIRNNDGTIIPYLEEGVTRLENSGASFIAIPCNTVHYFYEEMDRAVSIPIINMIVETVAEVKLKYPGLRNIGLLATTGTIESKLYEDELIANGYNAILPDEDILIEKIMEAVWGIKAGTDRKVSEDLLFEAGNNVIDKGAELIILGCTEIPLAFNPDRVDIPVINATEILALRAISMYKKLNETK